MRDLVELNYKLNPEMKRIEILKDRCFEINI